MARSRLAHGYRPKTIDKLCKGMELWHSGIFLEIGYFWRKEDRIKRRFKKLLGTLVTERIRIIAVSGIKIQRNLFRMIIKNEMNW